MQEEPRVFISYSSDAALFVKQIEAEIREAGIEIWVDRRLRAGDNLPVEISEALSWCNVLLLIWSKSSSQSDWVKLEWTSAVSLHKRIVPLLLDETPLPSILSHKTYISSNNPKQRRLELLRALAPSEQPESVAASVSHTSFQAAAEHSQKKRTTPQTTKQLLKSLSVILAFLAIVAVTTVTVKYLTKTDPGVLSRGDTGSGGDAGPGYSGPAAPVPGTGNADSHQKSTVLLIIVDFSPSLSPFQLQQVVKNANIVLNGMPVGTSYGIYQVQSDWDRASALETATVQLPISTIAQEERIKRLELARDNGSHLGRSSCLVDSLPFAQRFFRRYDPNKYQYELIYLSDMVEDCNTPLVDRTLTLSNVQLHGLQFTEIVDLSDVHITVIIPTLEASRRPNRTPPQALPELRALWKEIFKHCGLSEARLSKEEWFYFSTFLPNRFL